METLTNKLITVQVDDDAFGTEGRAFADWCERQGYEVEHVERVSGGQPALPEGLWDRYCAS